MLSVLVYILMLRVVMLRYCHAECRGAIFQASLIFESKSGALQCAYPSLGLLSLSHKL